MGHGRYAPYPTDNHISTRLQGICNIQVIFRLILLTHWGWVTHICVSKQTIIGSDNGLSPDRRQAIIWTNAGLLLIWPLRTNFSEILIEILTFSFKKVRLKVSSAKRRPFCLGLNVLSNILFPSAVPVPLRLDFCPVCVLWEPRWSRWERSLLWRQVGCVSDWRLWSCIPDVLEQWHQWVSYERVCHHDGISKTSVGVSFHATTIVLRLWSPSY